MSLDLRVWPSIDSCESLKVEWEELLDSCPRAKVFDTFSWVKANLLAFENSKTWVLVFRDAKSQLVAVIPLVVRRGRRYLRVCQWVEFAGLPYADYGSCLVRPGWESQVAEGVVALCSFNVDCWDGIHLDRFEAEAPFSMQVAAAARSQGWTVDIRETNRIRRLTKDEYAAEERMEQSSKGLRKARNRLQQEGELGFEVFDRADQILERLETFFAWHVERFAAKGLQSPFADLRHRAFYRHMVEGLAPEGRIWLSVLTCGRIPVAMRVSPLFGGTLHLYSTCFNAEFAKYSPSMLHLEMLLEHAFRSGIVTVDFGIGESPQKEFAGSGNPQALVTLEIYREKTKSIEGRVYRAAEQMRSRSRLVRWVGKMLRRLLPYSVR